MNTPDTFGGKTVLTVAHVAGMVDMVALPVWIGTLIQYYRFSPPMAGITVTVFLLGVVVASGVFAPRFNRLPRRAAAASGFTVAALAFWMASRQPVDPAGFQALAGLHAVAGLGVGCALTFTHGAIGRSRNPHRLFAVVNIALGFFAIAFLGGVPQLLQHGSASLFFTVVAASMAVAAVVTAFAFPRVSDLASAPGTAAGLSVLALPTRIPRAGWFVIGTVICLTLNQAMVFSFLERIGADRGFGVDRVNGVLIALGLVNLLPGALAALLQKKWSPVAVGIAGPIGQAVLAVTMANSLTFAPYAVSASFFVFMVIFTHNFLFGLLSRLDASGRAAAATPAMMMVGSCIGPALGGVIVQVFGYPGLGVASCVVATVAVLCMLKVRKHLPAPVAFAQPPLGGGGVIILYGSMMSRAHRVVWMLKELGLAFEQVQTSFLDGSTRTPDFLALNPNGRVPVLDDGGFLLHESLAINLYLAKRYPGPLTPIGLQEEALATQWSFWVATEVEKPLLLASANRALFADGSRSEEEAVMAVGKLERPLRVLDAHLRERPHLLGERFTVADLNVATVLDLAPQCGISLAAFEHVAEWHARCLERPAAADWKTVTFRIPRPPTPLGVLRMFV